MAAVRWPRLDMAQSKGTVDSFHTVAENPTGEIAWIHPINKALVTEMPC